jgi:hypothetical protein
MEKVLPVCECGKDVVYEYIYEPVYEDGVMIAHKPAGVVFGDICQDCYDSTHRAHLPITKDEDELPF